MTGSAEQRVVVVTGGGAGIGAAIAEELGRRGDLVVTLDPLVTLDGSEALPAPEETTAGRIVAAGGAAQASSVSVTDRDGVAALFASLVDAHGRLDAVVNVAGITRPTSVGRGEEQDWRAVLEVHLDGYLNVLRAALPIMAEAGRGHVLGVTSGSGWRAADAGAYSCAKRAVAALTWQLGAAAPPGVVVNAISPIAVTRMVTAALARAGGGGAGPAASGSSRASATGGLSLGAMPDPADLGPLAAHLVDPTTTWCRGQVVFAGGSEVALVEPPRLLEVVRTDTAPSIAHLLDVVVPGALAPAEERQAGGGGANPRFPAAFAASDPGGEPDTAGPAEPLDGSVLVVTGGSSEGGALVDAIQAAGAEASVVAAPAHPTFAEARSVLADAPTTVGAVVVATGELAPATTEPDAAPWRRILDAHDGLVAALHGDAAWIRAAIEVAATRERPVRLVVLTDATTAGGRSRAQAVAQLSRAVRRATKDAVTTLAIGREGDDISAAVALAAHLAAGPDPAALAGAELAAGDRWIGVRSHPRAGTGIVLGAPDLPPWFDDVLREAAGSAPDPER